VGGGPGGGGGGGGGGGLVTLMVGEVDAEEDAVAGDGIGCSGIAGMAGCHTGLPSTG
jgi:hypothetical protein